MGQTMLRATWHPAASKDPDSGSGTSAPKGWRFEVLTGQEADAVAREVLGRPEADGPTGRGARWWLEQRMSTWSRVQRPAMHSHWSW